MIGCKDCMKLGYCGFFQNVSNLSEPTFLLEIIENFLVKISIKNQR